MPSRRMPPVVAFAVVAYGVVARPGLAGAEALDGPASAQGQAATPAGAAAAVETPPASAPGASTASDDPAALLARAAQLHQKGDLASAVGLYERVLALAPANPRIRSNLGAAYARLGRFEEAIAQYQQALAGEDGNTAIRLNLAIAHYRLGHFEAAAAEAVRVVGAEPRNEGALLLLAECELRLGQSRKVVDLLQPLEGLAQERARSYLLGMALIAEGRPAEAARAMDAALRDDAPEAHVLLAAMYAKDDDCAKAVPEVRKALERNPSVPLANYLDGKCRMADTVNDWKGAAEAFRRELAVDPNHFEANLLLGSLLREEARHEEALPFLERAVRLRASDAAASFSLGAAYVGLSRNADALPLLEQVAAAVPDHVQTQMQLAVLYHRLGRGADEARAKQAVARLQANREERFFHSVNEALGRLLGKTAGSAASGP